MEKEETQTQQISPRKMAFRKRAGIYTVIFIICLVVSLLMHEARIGGIISGLVSIALVVFLILAIIALIRGFTGK